MVRYKKWHIGTGVTYQSVVQNIDGAFTLLIQGVQESVDQELSEHLVFNTRVGYEINSRWDSNLIFSNITNKEYTIRPADIASPRSIRFQIAYTLDKSK
jgi:outer membrane receptor for ferric coprogen and ferric-rhodotorulic acid